MVRRDILLPCVHARIHTHSHCGGTAVIFLDGDAYINSPELSLSDIIQKWNFHPRASFAMALEGPGQRPPNNEPNDTAVNAGFMIIRSGPRAQQILRALHMCPDKVNGCDMWRTQWAHEQTTFNKMLRQSGVVVDGEDLVLLPCRAFNGWWGWEVCHGDVVTHAWFNKDDEAGRMRDLLAREHVKLYERMLKQGYHVMNCTSWEEGVDERCIEPDE